MRVSVIVPAYNAEQSLEECVESLLCQTFRDFELLLVNDGSRDATAALCDAYALRDSRVRVFHKSNGGVASARNRGLDAAVGEWVTFVDSDDTVAEEHLATLVASSDGAEFSIAGITIHDLATGEVQRRPLRAGLRSGAACGAALAELCESDDLGWAVAKLFRRDIIESHNLRVVEVSYREDELFAIDYCCHIESIGIADECTYRYLSRPTGLTRRRKNIGEHIAVNRLLYAAYTRLNVDCGARMGFFAAKRYLVESFDDLRDADSARDVAAICSNIRQAYEGYKRYVTDEFIVSRRDKKMNGRLRIILDNLGAHDCVVRLCRNMIHK